jgi:predicted nucleic acid-binding protein
LPVRSLSEVAEKPLSSVYLLVDTSYILACIGVNEDDSEEAKRFKDVHRGRDVIFCINAMIQQELLKHARRLLIIDELQRQYGEARADKILGYFGNVTKRYEGDLGKYLIALGHLGVVQKALKGRLKDFFGAFDLDFEYMPGPHPPKVEGENESGELKFNDAVLLMEKYGLNSTDALIFNFAEKVGVDGLVTCDGDFEMIGKKRGVNVYMPRRLIGRPITTRSLVDFS